MLEVKDKDLESGKAGSDGLQSNSCLREIQKLQDENAKLYKKISELENQIFEQNSKQSDQNETRKLQIQITQLEQSKFLINAQLSQREATITQLQRQIQGLVEESSMKSEGDQYIQERKKNAELQLQISSFDNQEKVWKSKLNDIEYKLKEQVLINQNWKLKQILKIPLQSLQILKKEDQKRSINCLFSSVLYQIKLFQKENKSLTIREEDDEQLILQKLQQYRGDYINFRFRVEQILTRITALKQQMLQVISEAKIQGKKKNQIKIWMQKTQLCTSNYFQIHKLFSTQYEAELKSFQNNTSPQGQIIQQVKELLTKALLLTQQQIYQFAEPKVSIKLRKDQDEEDARLILEARNQQIQWLKNFIKEKQDQLAL
ncbi:unnamed protein product [Paramecium octaurelia]|uniref:Uncharacterized protein n=1 Tax=Paramecium octaurelia TaxID=43137 RepID=A0A8S1S0X0_PAROT|nr:unnamed protein product [Paramecium octaurelia]